MLYLKSNYFYAFYIAIIIMTLSTYAVKFPALKFEQLMIINFYSILGEAIMHYYHYDTGNRDCPRYQKLCF